ncbi:MAG TPA: hypothetical protein VGE89_03565 [Bryobacteraceae bacterium]|jgi:hypothetical protein
MNLVRSAWAWFRRQVVEDVPAEDALCEFDCRKPDCDVGAWETCERRLQNAAGELMPPQKPASEQASIQSIESKRERA